MKGSWEDHARLFHSAGVLLNAHGSVNTNSFFQQPGSAALEMHGYGQDFKEWYHSKGTMGGVHYADMYDFVEDVPKYKNEEQRLSCLKDGYWNLRQECLAAIWRTINPNIFIFEYCSVFDEGGGTPYQAFP